MPKSASTEMPEPTRLIVTFAGDPDVNSHQIYTCNGLEIPKGTSEMTITSKMLPDDFPLSLAELAAQLETVPGMEVTRA